MAPPGLTDAVCTSPRIHFGQELRVAEVLGRRARRVREGEEEEGDENAGREEPHPPPWRRRGSRGCGSVIGLARLGRSGQVTAPKRHAERGGASGGRMSAQRPIRFMVTHFLALAQSRRPRIRPGAPLMAGSRRARSRQAPPVRTLPEPASSRQGSGTATRLILTLLIDTPGASQSLAGGKDWRPCPSDSKRTTEHPPGRATTRRGSPRPHARLGGCRS